MPVVFENHLDYQNQGSKNQHAKKEEPKIPGIKKHINKGIMSMDYCQQIETERTHIIHHKILHRGKPIT